MMCCCLLDSKASVMVLPRHLVTWLGPHEAGPCCQSRSRWWTWGTRGHRPTTSLVNAKQKLLRSQSFFQHTSPRPTNFNVVWPNCFTMNHYTCRIWLSTLKLGGEGPSLSSVVGVKKDKVRHPGNWSRPCKVPEMGARSL